MKKSILVITLIIVISLSACGNKDVDALNQKLAVVTPVEVQNVQVDDISTINRLNGSIVAKNEVSIFSPISGEVVNVNVKVGDKVNKNQILFSVDNESLSRNYQALLADYNRTKSLLDRQIDLAKQSLEDTKIIYNEKVRLAKQSADNTYTLFEVGAATSIDVDNAKFALEQTEIGAKSAIKQSELSLTSTQNSAESTLTQLENNIKDVEETLDKTYAKSTINGTVTAINVKKGSMASPQSVAVMVSGDEEQQIKISVSEKIIPYIEVGDSAEVRVNAAGGKDFTCNIYSISPSANSITHLYDVYLNLPENTNTLLGMFAEVILKTDMRENTITIPTQAILNDGEVQYVYITTDENTAKKVVVETGLIGENVTEIENGLKVGDVLIIKGQSYLSDGSSLRIVGRA